MVPDDGDLVATILTAAHEHFVAERYEAAEAFLGLVRQTDRSTDPAETWARFGHLQFAFEDYEAAGRSFGNAAAYHPEDATLQANLALICLRLGDQDNFQGYLRRALLLEPENALALGLLEEFGTESPGSF